jgi:XTP/dITP diphosphohydrolase
MPILYACSSNPGKLLEFTFTAQRALTGNFDIKPLPRMNEITPPPEDAETYQENAERKALYYSQFTQDFVFADDSGLEVEALDGAPGVLSARFAGLHASGPQNNALLLEKLAGAANRRARFVTAVSLAKQGKVLQTTTGTADGEILTEPRGTLGFGYDALFLFPPLGRTFAELGDAEKFAISARGHAFRQLLTWLEGHKG